LNLQTHNFRRILIVKSSSLGDIIHALPLLSGLRVRYPQARISWLLNTEYVDLLKDHPQLDEVIPFDRRQFKTLAGAVKMTFKLGGFARVLREGEFDLAVDVQGLFRSGLMAFASGAAVRLGFAPARECSGIFYTHRVAIPGADMHAVDKNYLPARLLGFADHPVEFNLPVSPQAKAAVSTKLAEKSFDADQPYAVIVPGSRWETKNWQPERFGEAVAYLQSELKLGTVLSGSPAETDLCRLIARSCPQAPAVLAGELGLTEWAALLQGAAVVLCNDSAALHLAVALGRPVVTIFGPTNPGRTGPYGRPASVLQAGLPCAPCYYRRLKQCPIQHRCMTDIDLAQVTRALAAALSPMDGA
jgi:lipopolysaccharide heptosyltransferase I